MDQTALLSRLKEAEAQLDALRSGTADALIGTHGALFLLVDEMKARLAAEAQRRAIYAHQQALIEAERKRLAREVHDELGQKLTALRMELSLMRIELAGDDRQLRVSKALELIESLLHSVRSIAGNLRPAALDLGLVPAIEWVLQDFERRWRIPCLFHCHTEPVDTDEPTALTAIRVLQESLTNIARHAGASQVLVRLDCQDSRLAIEIRDDGRGFDPASVAAGCLGLIGMRDRLLEIGGSFCVDSAPNHGTRILAHIPIRRAP